MFASADSTAAHMLQAVAFQASIGQPSMPFTASMPTRSWHGPGAPQSSSVAALTQAAAPLLLTGTVNDSGSKSEDLQATQRDLQGFKEMYESGTIDESELVELKLQAFLSVDESLSKPFNFKVTMETFAAWASDGLVSDEEFKNLKRKAIQAHSNRVRP